MFLECLLPSPHPPSPGYTQVPPLPSLQTRICSFRVVQLSSTQQISTTLFFLRRKQMREGETESVGYIRVTMKMNPQPLANSQTITTVVFPRSQRKRHIDWKRQPKTAYKHLHLLLTTGTQQKHFVAMLLTTGKQQKHFVAMFLTTGTQQKHFVAML